MAQTIQHKRSTGSSAPASLAQGELAFSKGSGTLYIGDPATVDTPIAISAAIINNAGTASLGTGITAAEIRTVAGVDVAGTDNSTDVTLAGSYDYLTIAGQVITLAQIDASTDISGLSTIATTGALSDATGSTTDISEGTNEYFTTTRARNSVSGGTGVTYTAGTGVIEIGQAVAVTDNVTFNDIIVDGNLTVNGTTTTLNTETLTVDDNIIVLNNNEAGTPSANAGIEIERGTSSNVLLRWNETTDTWQVTTDGSTYEDLITSGTQGGVASITTSADGLGNLSTATGAVTVTLDLSELTDMTATVDGAADEMVLLDAGLQRRKLLSEINLSEFNNDSGWTSNAGLITGVTAGVGISGGGSSGDVTVDLDFSELTDMTATIAGTTEFIVQDAGTESRKAASEIALSFFNNDSGWTSNAGTVTNVTAGVGLSGGGTSTPTLDLDFTELTDMTATVTGATEAILLNGTTESRKTLNEIVLSAFNNDSGWTNNTGTITQVVAGQGLSGGGASGSVTVDLDFSELTDMVGNISGATEFIIQDGSAESRKAASEIQLSFFNNDSGWTSNAGDITSIQVQSTDASITGVGTASSGAAVFDLEVGTIDGGTY